MALATPQGVGSSHMLGLENDTAIKKIVLSVLIF